MFSLEKRGFRDDSGDSLARLTEMFLGSKAAHKTMISTGAAPAGMDMHGLAGKPKQLAQYAKNPWKTSRFERRGQEPNN
jgi:hypothetical protein